MLRKDIRHKLRAGGALAALMFLAAASPLQAQVIGANPFVPSGPIIGAPLGGGVLGSTVFGPGINTGFSSFNIGFNPGFNLPLNADFNTLLAAANSQRTFEPTVLDFNARLAQFNAQRIAATQQFADQNSALNVPLSNFAQQQPLLFPSGTPVFLTSNGFSQVNPSLGPFLANGVVNGSLGFSGFNNFNALNGFGGFSSLVPTTGISAVNNGFNSSVAAATPIVRPTPGQFNRSNRLLHPTFATAANATGAQFTSTVSPMANEVVIRRSGWEIPWPFPPPDQRVPGGIYMMSNGATSRVSAGTAVAPMANEVVIRRSGWEIPWPFPPPSQRVPGGIYMMSGSGMRAPLAGRPISAFGAGSGMTVMGGRAR